MTPAEFLEAWNHLIGADPSKPKLYKGEQNRLLAEVLGLEESSVKNWGADWARMPEQYETTLEYANQLRESIEATCTGRLAEIILSRLSD